MFINQVENYQYMSISVSTLSQGRDIDIVIDIDA